MSASPSKAESTRLPQIDSSVAALRAQMRCDLHDLCQPLTALQFKLEMSTLVQGSETLQRAVEGGLEETRRLFEAVATMRNHLLDETPQE